jgi:ELWxxDGT repeat protein
VLVADISRGVAPSSPSGLSPVGKFLLFTAWDPTYGRELWRTDGTTIGTVPVVDIVRGPGSSLPTFLTPVGSTLFLTVQDRFRGLPIHGQELWVSDGTPQGTHLVADIVPGTGSPFTGPSVPVFVAVGQTLFFSANGPDTGMELWKSDGTAGGTILTRDILPGAGSGLTSFPFPAAVGDTLFFAANDGTHGQELWKSDGTEAGTVMVKDIASGR